MDRRVPRDSMFNVRLTRDEHTRLRRLSAEVGRSMSDIMRDCWRMVAYAPYPGIEYGYVLERINEHAVARSGAIARQMNLPEGWVEGDNEG